jgi:hypothetical protein
MKEETKKAPNREDCSATRKMESTSRVFVLAVTALMMGPLLRSALCSMIAEAYHDGTIASLSTSHELLDGPLNDAFHRETTSILNNLGDLQELSARIAQIEQEQDRVLQDLKVLDELLSQVNRKQLNAFIQKLTEIETVELARREAESAPATLASTGASGDPVALDISAEELDSIFDPDSILGESDADIAAWISKVLEDETEKLLGSLQAPDEGFSQSIDVTTKGSPAAGLTGAAPSTTLNNANNCTSPGIAALQVQRAVHQFANDGIGLRDHAQGSTVLYERTTDTYQPPTSDTLGSVWWSRFIPDDWEQWLLSEGWEEWNAMPQFISHTFGTKRGGAFFHSGVSPPSTIFHGTALPGSCWPMAGSSGRVTFQLPYPVKVSAVSLEHASALLLANKASISSAPKKLAVYGYPACQQSCRGLGFDESRKLLLATIEYEKDKGGIQSFSVRAPTPVTRSSLCSAVAEAYPQSAEGSPAGSSCSAAPPSESAEPVVGIELVVLENWGNVEYTCLYRFRVHGEAANVGSR